MKNQIKNLTATAGCMIEIISTLKAYGLDLNNILVSQNGISVSVKTGIEKAAGVMGEELSKSPSGVHLGFDAEGVHFGQRLKDDI